MRIYIVEDTEAGYRYRTMYLSDEKPPEDSTQVLRGELEVTVVSYDKTELTERDVKNIILGQFDA